MGRVTANVLGESTVGVILTDGDPQSNLDSSLFGADFRYRNSRLPGGRLLESQAWVEQTSNEGVNGEDRAFGFGVSMPNSTGWRGTLNTRHVERNFAPAVGFVDRVGIRDYALDWGYRLRFSDRWLRSVYAGFDGYRVEALDTGHVESQVAGLRLTFQNNTQDNFFMRLVANREVLLEDFQIYAASDGSEIVVIPPGDYRYNDFRIGTQTGDQRNFALRASISGGEFYDGNRLNTNLELTWRPSEHYRFGINYEKNDIELPYGDFVVNLATLRADFIFSSTLSWVNLIQYDDVTENLGINSRLHWIPRAGREGFIVFNHSLSDADKDGSFQSTSADASVKFSYTFRF